MTIVKIGQFKKQTDRGQKEARYRCGDCEGKIFFSKIQVGYGFRPCFVCPSCGHYRFQLIFNGKQFLCFQCAGVNPYEGIQTTTRGGYNFIAYKMARFAAKNGVEGFHFPFNFYDYERPKRRRCEKWNRAIKILQALESMRNQSIFFGKVWDTAVIKSVENGTNEYLQCSVYELREYFYPFDGKEINTRLNV